VRVPDRKRPKTMPRESVIVIFPKPLFTTRHPSPGVLDWASPPAAKAPAAPMERTSKVASTRGRIGTQGIAAGCACLERDVKKV